MRRLAWLALALFCLVGGGWWYWTLAAKPVVSFAVVRRGSAAEVVYASGAVEPRRWAKVVSMQRKRIVWTCDCEGQRVKAGDVLARLDDVEERASLAELEARRKRLELDTERLKALVARNAAAQTTYDQSLTQLQEYQARIDAQSDRVADLTLRAPMDGVVLRRDGEVGEIAGTGAGDALFWIGEPKPLRVVSDVNEEDIPRVVTGQKALLRSDGFPGQTLPSTVAEITPKGDPVAKTFRVYLALPDDTPLRVGMSVEANIVTREVADALLAPAEAIVEGAVFRLRDDRLERVVVSTGVHGPRLVEIRSGLAEGDLVASPASPALRDGERARRARDTEEKP